jgi:hypothetical protein
VSRLTVASDVCPHHSEPGAQQRNELKAQRQRTGDAADEFERSVRNWRVRVAASDESQARIDAVVARLDQLPEIQRSVEERSTDRAGAAQAYTDIVESLLRMYGALGNLDDDQVSGDTRTLIQLCGWN